MTPDACFLIPDTRRKERELNPQGSRSAVFETAAIANWLALPFAPERWALRSRCQVWMAGFEPAFSGSRSRRIEPGSPTSRCTRPSPLAPLQVGPEGLEPSPRWLRARHAAANTWIPQSARRELNPRLALIRGRLWPLSYGPETNDE